MTVAKMQFLGLQFGNKKAIVKSGCKTETEKKGGNQWHTKQQN
jgi:hypothetical protein